ncbi:MAG: ABC transporter ATP-binding protein [Anaerohalosphaera sp.]|nr:ABC transporter ATP-binding protein [Anaerohalosphaera sp.]
MHKLRLEKVSRIFNGDVVAVSDVSFDVSPGQTLVLTGPSGAGKTTILRMIAGLDKPTSGSIFLDDQRINDVEPRHRNIAMVFQNFSLYPHMNIQDNMGFALKMRKTPKQVIRDKVANIAKELEIENLLKRKPCQLSGGQRQRAALGKVMVAEPKIFLFDEPLSNLDRKLRISARQQIKELLKRLNATAVYVTHDQTEAEVLADKICVLDAGTVMRID